MQQIRNLLIDLGDHATGFWFLVRDRARAVHRVMELTDRTPVFSWPLAELMEWAIIGDSDRRAPCGYYLRFKLALQPTGTDLDRTLLW